MPKKVFHSFIVAEREAREAREAKTKNVVNDLWVGEGWRDHRQTKFREAFELATRVYGVPYNVVD